MRQTVARSGFTPAFLLALLVSFLVALSPAAASAAAADPTAVREDFVNTNLHRIFDLTNPTILREHSTVVIKAVNDAKDYYLSVPAEIADKSLAIVEVEVRKSKGEKGDKAVVMKDKYDASRSAQLYKVKLSSTLKKDESVYLIVNAAYTHAVHPYPKEVAQKDMQHLEHTGNAYFWSPYHSERQKTTVRLPSADILRFSAQPDPVTKSGNVVTYGPYDNVEPYAKGTLHVHYADPKAILVVTSLERKMEISHLGANLAVQEDYELHHEGAKLKGHFSRVDYSFTQWTHGNTNVVKDLTITLPPGAKHVFFRDTIGNVSTSNLRAEREQSTLQIRPRYPIYGGWKYTWHHGYNVPTKNFLKQDSKTSEFVFRVPFIGGLPNVTIAKAVVSIVFPEGAQNFKIRKPFDMDRVTERITHTYLDTTGRPTIVFEKHNVVDEHSQPLLITYELPVIHLIQKPLAVTAAFLGLFLLGAIYSRLDLSISKDPRAEQEHLMQAYRSTVHGLTQAETKLLSKLNGIFESLKSDRRLDDYRHATGEIEQTIRDGWASLLAAAKNAEESIAHKLHLSTADSSAPAISTPSPAAQLAGHIRHLQRLQEERLTRIRAMHEQVVNVSKDPGLTSDQRRELTDALAVQETEIDALGEKIKEAGKKVTGNY
ncbi:proteasome regulatory particle base subunit [Thoreauomyces humboldtii]|nr:proteasome regulatory particle base subunit [Thoreauomyces humboldtii]